MEDDGVQARDQVRHSGRLDKTVAVRLEGGLGDHLLGMRVLPFILKRYPEHKIVVYSDAAGHHVPLRLTAMSPLVSLTIPVYSRPKDRTTVGRLENLRAQDLSTMFSADIFIDGWGGDMFVAAAMTLNVPVFDILAVRPLLTVPSEAQCRADELLRRFTGASFVALNLSKYGVHVLRRYEAQLARVLIALLEWPNVVVLNMFNSDYEFSHWPEPERARRRECAREESVFLRRICASHDRVVPCEDFDLQVIAALLKRCAYFIGVDNGIKHLAWAIGVPRTFFVSVAPKLLGMLRWMPDANRMLLFGAPDTLIDLHIATAREHLGSRWR